MFSIEIYRYSIAVKKLKNVILSFVLLTNICNVYFIKSFTKHYSFFSYYVTIERICINFILIVMKRFVILTHF